MVKASDRAARAIIHRALVVRMVEICDELRSGPPLDEALPLMEEFSCAAWQLGFPISPPDDEIQVRFDEQGWLLRPYVDPYPDQVTTEDA